MNLTKNSYYVTQYDDFGSGVRPVVNSLAERLTNSIDSIHPEDRDLYKNTFSVENQIEAYKRGEEVIDLVVRQIGGDGIYRRVHITNIFVESPAVTDILAVSLYDIIEELPPEEIPVPPKPEVKSTELAKTGKTDIIAL